VYRIQSRQRGFEDITGRFFSLHCRHNLQPIHLGQGRPRGERTCPDQNFTAGIALDPTQSQQNVVNQMRPENQQVRLMDQGLEAGPEFSQQRGFSPAQGAGQRNDQFINPLGKAALQGIQHCPSKRGQDTFSGPGILDQSDQGLFQALAHGSRGIRAEQRKTQIQVS